MSSDVAAYVRAIDPARRPLFDRVHGLVTEVHPDAQMVLSYGMPTYVVGGQQLHVGVWKHGLSFYGRELRRDGGLAERYPQLDNGRGTLKLPLRHAAQITDEALRAFLAAVLSTPEQRPRAGVTVEDAGGQRAGVSLAGCADRPSLPGCRRPPGA